MLFFHDLSVNLLLRQSIGWRVTSLHASLLQLILLLFPQRYEVHDGVGNRAMRTAVLTFTLLTFRSFLATLLALSHASLRLSLFDLIGRLQFLEFRLLELLYKLLSASLLEHFHFLFDNFLRPRLLFLR